MCNIHPCSSGLHHCYQGNNISMGLSSHYCARWPGPWFNIKMSSYHYRKSYCQNKTAERSSCLHNGISCIDKMSSLYGIRALGWCIICFITLDSSQINSKFLTLIWGNLLCNKTLPLIWYHQGSGNHQTWYWHSFCFIIHYTQNVNILYVNFYQRPNVVLSKPLREIYSFSMATMQCGWPMGFTKVINYCLSIIVNGPTVQEIITIYIASTENFELLWQQLCH